MNRAPGRVSLIRTTCQSSSSVPVSAAWTMSAPLAVEAEATSATRPLPELTSLWPLLSLGRRRVAAIGDQPYPTREAAQLRTRGYRLAHERAGVPVREEYVVSTPRFNRSDGAGAMAHLLDLAEPPDAVFCYSDLVALGALHTLAGRGLRVPKDVAIVGYDDIEDARYANPPVTTVSPDKKMIAETAVERLLKRIGSNTPVPGMEIRAPTASSPGRARWGAGRRRATSDREVEKSGEGTGRAVRRPAFGAAPTYG